jgi:hypothetical protein
MMPVMADGTASQIYKIAASEQVSIPVKDSSPGNMLRRKIKVTLQITVTISCCSS